MRTEKSNAIDWSKNSNAQQRANREDNFRTELKKTNYKRRGVNLKNNNGLGSKELLELTKELQKVGSEIKEYKRKMEEEYGKIKYVLFLKVDPHFLGLLAKRRDIRKQIRELRKNG